MARQLYPLPPGAVAPHFSLQRSQHAAFSLTDLRGNPAILVFYPTDWEPVSRQQLALYQDYLAAFERLGAELCGISTDHIWSHVAFAWAVGIRYPLLADAHPQGAVCRAYGVFDEQVGLSGRALFLLDEQGVIRWSQSCPAAVNPGVGGILIALESLVSSRSVDDRHAPQ